MQGLVRHYVINQVRNKPRLEQKGKVMDTNSIPKYSIRGHNIWGFKDMAHFWIIFIKVRKLKVAL